MYGMRCATQSMPTGSGQQSIAFCQPPGNPSKLSATAHVIARDGVLTLIMSAIKDFFGIICHTPAVLKLCTIWASENGGSTVESPINLIYVLGILH
jgi:hypothetical protein